MNITNIYFEFWSLSYFIDDVPSDNQIHSCRKYFVPIHFKDNVLKYEYVIHMECIDSDFGDFFFYG